MEPVAQRCINTFWASIPRHLARNFLRSIVEWYRKADADARDRFDAPEAHYIRGPQRRAGIEGELRRVAELDSETRASTEWNKARSQAYTLIKRRQIQFTCSRVESRYDVVRHASFRRELAELSQYHLLFDGSETPEEVPVLRLYAMLIHTPDERDPSRPAFVDVVFPDRECETYVARIDLLREFPEIFGDTTPPPTDPTDPTDPSDPDPPVTLRRDRKPRRSRREKEA